VAISYNPDVGEVLICDFGQFRDPPLTPAFDGRLPPEMIKRRPVVVLSSKISRACIVVPLSTTLDKAKLAKGMHVEVPKQAIPELAYFTPETRWAKSDLVSQVSHERLYMLRDPSRSHTHKHHLSRELVAEIQKAVIKSISASWLLAPAIDETINKQAK